MNRMRDPLKVRCRHCGRSLGSHVRMSRGDLCPEPTGKTFKAIEKLVRVFFRTVQG
jgi:hypothetical protein